MAIIEKYDQTEPLFFDTHNPKAMKARRNALAQFKALGLPSRRLDGFKYTDLSRFSLEDFHPVDTVHNPVRLDTPSSLHPLLIDRASAQQWVFYNGRALKEFNPDLFKASLDWSSPLPFKNSLLALNHAFYQPSMALILPKNKVIHKPLYVLYLTEADGLPIMGNPKNKIIVEENTHAILIESVVNRGAHATFTNTVTDIELKKGATLSHVFLQYAENKSTQIAHLNILQGENSCYRGTTVLMGGLVNRTSVDIVLQGEKAECEFQALNFSKPANHVDLNLSVHHDAPFTESRAITRGVVFEEAKSVFTGKIIVSKTAPKTKALLENKNILLSRTAKAYTEPQLEIHQNDVQCAHGATVGELDTNALFYLKSRGIPPEEAEALLIQSFMAPSLEALPLEIKTYMEPLYAF